MTSLDEYQEEIESLKTAIRGLEDKLYAEEVLDRLKEKFELDLEPVANAMAEILSEISGLAKRVTALEVADNSQGPGATDALLSAIKKVIAKYGGDE